MSRLIIPPAVWFTPRERQLLELFTANPVSNKELAWQMNLSTGTIKHFFTNIQTKIGVSGRIQVYAWALAHRESVERGVFRPAPVESPESQPPCVAA